MRALVACEFSGVVRRALRAQGVDAWSCDLLSAEDGDRCHLQQDVRQVLACGWDLLIAHPPCTHLAVSGNRWRKAKQASCVDEALDFVRLLMDAPVPHIAIENPVSIIGSRIRKSDQTFHPWQFWAGERGTGEVKRTCLWLKNLPRLVPTTPDEPGRIARVWKMPPGPDRWKARSRTYPGIAEAMAVQWVAHIRAMREAT